MLKFAAYMRAEKKKTVLPIPYMIAFVFLVLERKKDHHPQNPLNAEYQSAAPNTPPIQDPTLDRPAVPSYCC